MAKQQTHKLTVAVMRIEDCDCDPSFSLAVLTVPPDRLAWDAARGLVAAKPASDNAAAPAAKAAGAS